MQRMRNLLKALGSKNGVRLMALVIYALVFGIPSVYAYLGKYPNEDTISIEVGKATFQYRMKRGYMLVVNGMSYSCEGPASGSSPDCFSSREEHSRLEGKTVSVAWFHQPVHLLSERRRVVDIRYEGVSQLPPSFLQRQLQSERKWAVDDAVVGFVFLLIGLLFYEWLDRIRKRNERKFDQGRNQGN